MGWTDRRIRLAVAEGRLLRLRDGVLCDPAVPSDCADAGRAGGRLTCLSELSRLGVFVLEARRLHVHVDPTASRLRDPRPGIRRHWAALRRTPHPLALTVEVFDALLHSVRCQPARAVVATIDSALHLGLLHPDDLDELFDALPRRHRRLRRLIDARAESGPESLMRLILRSIGCSFEPQVQVPGVGRVDFLVDGWLIVECDSRGFHAGWEQQRLDRRRDQIAAARGHATYRPIAEDIMWHRDDVRAAVVGLLSARRR